MPVNYNDAARIAYLAFLDSEDKSSEAWLRTLREYARGEHPTFLTDRQKEFIGLLAKDTNHLYAHNLCPLVIATVVERMAVTGFAVTDPGGPGVALAEAAQEWWELNRMDAVQDDLYEAACRDGESYLIVDWRDGAPHWTLNYAYDGTQGVKLHRDPVTGEPTFASKRWQEYDPFRPERTGRTRLTLYFPDRVEKYVSGDGMSAELGSVRVRVGWEAYTEEDSVWPLPWVDGTGEPLGLPVIAFSNPAGSEIEDIVSLQDLLNKSDLDLIAGADGSGFRILWGSGVTANVDPSTGLEKAITLSPSTFIRLSDANARVGAIEPPDLSQMIATSRYWIECIAAISRTPQYLFSQGSADQPSGESLKQQEIGLISKCRRKQKVFGNAWEDAVYLSARLSATFGSIVLAGRLQTQWEQIGSRDDLAEAQVVQAQVAAGTPLVTAYRWQGRSETELEQLIADQEEERTRQTNSLALAMLEQQRRFDRGQTGEGAE